MSQGVVWRSCLDMEVLGPLAVSALLIQGIGRRVIITLALVDIRVWVMPVVVMWPESHETCGGAKGVALWLRLARTVSTVASRIVSN